MLDDKNPFGNHPLKGDYQTFKRNITTAVNQGKMDSITAMHHMNSLHNFAMNQQHDMAGRYMKEHSQKLGFSKQSGFQSEEKWSKNEKWGE